jgi:hypothetical protein
MNQQSAAILAAIVCVAFGCNNDNSVHSLAGTDKSGSEDEANSSDNDSESSIPNTCVPDIQFVGTWIRKEILGDLPDSELLQTTLVFNADGNCSASYRVNDVDPGDFTACTWCVTPEQFRLQYLVDDFDGETGPYLLDAENLYLEGLHRINGRDAEGIFESRRIETEGQEAQNVAEIIQSITLAADQFHYVSDEAFDWEGEQSTRHIEMDGAFSLDGRSLQINIENCISDDPQLCDFDFDTYPLYGCLLADTQILAFDRFQEWPMDCDGQHLVKQPAL